ncbi:MAG: DNA topoisomerase VI subunit B [Candidatus Aenigmarchaeota archaeon]|nr:DNA topoisomerase VI subunit B [Candidatus Aenigmarchaeota archaeon]
MKKEDKAKTAKDMALEQRAISVAEFFEKNRHLLGFDNPSKALLTVVKEAVDNSLDACEEANILPEIEVEIKELEENRYKITVEDNGPGILRDQIPRIFAKLLYGSKFHRLRQSRGQQGIGISASVLYAQLTTGHPAIIYSKPNKNGKVHVFHLKIDILKNEPEILKEDLIESGIKHPTGTKISIIIEGKYIQRYHSPYEYIKQTAIVNPWAHIKYKSPTGEVFDFPRAVNKLSKRPKEIKPHPYGVELGILIRMLKSTKSRNISAFLQNEFSRVGANSAEEICRLAGIDLTRKPQSLTHEEQEKLLKAMQRVKLMRPPTDCLSPIGEELLREGLSKEINAEFITTITRDPSVYRGIPFQIEAGIAYGGELKKNEETGEQAKLMRFANKIPLLYDPSGCAITKAVSSIRWRRYGLEQSGNALPRGPVIILVHIASAWVPYTSESKEAIANYPEIIKEIKLAVQECARRMLMYIRKQTRVKRETQRLSIFENYIPLIIENAKELAGIKTKIDIQPIIEKVVKKDLVAHESKGKENN